MDELLAKLHALYGQKWVSHVAGIPYAALRETWAEALDGWTKAQAKQALDICTRTMCWPPSVPDFISALDDGATSEQRAFQARLRAEDEAAKALPAETWAERRERGKTSLRELRAQLERARARPKRAAQARPRT